TAVVLTPAVFATARAAKVPPMPYLFACALIANAASFVLPISNPANLVVYAHAMPPLAAWLAMFLLPSVTAIAATYVALRLTLRRDLAEAAPQSVPAPVLEPAARAAALGIVATGGVLMAASARGLALGLPTLIAGGAVVLLVAALTRRSPLPILRDISWGVLPLVAGLFVLVEAVFATGLADRAVALLHHWAAVAPARAAFGTGALFGLVSNVINNLPVGLVAATAARTGDLAPHVTAAMLIGVDLGPNLSVTGSLATILWLVALRREGLHVSAASFLRVGVAVMPPALVLALVALAFGGRSLPGRDAPHLPPGQSRVHQHARLGQNRLRAGVKGRRAVVQHGGLPAGRGVEERRRTVWAEMVEEALHDHVEIAEQDRVILQRGAAAGRDGVNRHVAIDAGGQAFRRQGHAVIGRLAPVERGPVCLGDPCGQASDGAARIGRHGQEGQLPERRRPPFAPPAGHLHGPGIGMRMGAQVHQRAIAEDMREGERWGERGGLHVVQP
ncbi:MAG: hypothetical protein KGI94_17055, partial [Paracoccaceae bacterium]|nr:hypothetical protein [Paracoccaceae bacterium]